jgi:MFS transporter, DHA2 family, multidrug resistance protein
VAGRMMQRVDPRVMMAAGFVGFGIGTWWATWITKDWDFQELLAPQIFRGVSLMICMVAINNVALGTLPPSRMKNASGLYNLTRNLGGAVGLALINTLLNDRWDLHMARLHEAVTWSRGVAVDRLDQMTARFQGMGDTSSMALKQLATTARQQALVMSFGDVFLVLTFLFVSLSLATPFVKKPQAAGGGGGGH